MNPTNLPSPAGLHLVLFDRVIRAFFDVNLERGERAGELLHATKVPRDADTTNHIENEVREVFVTLIGMRLQMIDHVQSIDNNLQKHLAANPNLQALYDDLTSAWEQTKEPSPSKKP